MEKKLILEIEEFNKDLDVFYNEVLPEKLGIEKDGKINLSQWLKAQEIINAQGFYKQGMQLLHKYTSMGYDVKMNMQTNKLSY